MRCPRVAATSHISPDLWRGPTRSRLRLSSIEWVPSAESPIGGCLIDDGHASWCFGDVCSASVVRGIGRVEHSPGNPHGGIGDFPHC